MYTLFLTNLTNTTYANKLEGLKLTELKKKRENYDTIFTLSPLASKMEENTIQISFSQPKSTSR